MAEISAALIKQLRDKTSASLSACKKALEAADGDLELAIQKLREQGAVSAAKRADREAREGMIVTTYTPSRNAAVMVEVNCETDFVARNDDFIKFAQAVAALALAKRTPTIEALRAAMFEGMYDNQPVEKVAEEMVGKVGEKIEVKRIVLIEAEGGAVIDYVHPGAKLAAMVQLSGNGSDLSQIGKDLAMQVAAASPLVIERMAVPRESIEKEIEIYKQQAANDGKPAQVVERIATGKLEKYYQDVVLLEQAFIKDNGKTVTDVLKEAGEKLGAAVEVKRFERFQLGEK
ncbi:MAG: elongation factor Ts [Rhizobacter sp.]|nr:elongation factor Ts [Chlorobiales bacterium]